MNRMKVLREALGLSKNEVARRTGMAGSTVGAIENGKILPYDSQRAKISQALGIPESEAHTLLDPVEVRETAVSAEKDQADASPSTA